MLLLICQAFYRKELKCLRSLKSNIKLFTNLIMSHLIVLIPMLNILSKILPRESCCSKKNKKKYLSKSYKAYFKI